MRPAIFLDKDGTVLVDVPYNVDPARMRFAPGAQAALRLLGRLGSPLIIISNQSGAALGKFPLSALTGVHHTLARMFRDAGATLHAFYYCPHHPQGSVSAFSLACDCRKPAPGLLRRAAADHDLDLAASWFIGDILNDVEAGRLAGCRTILIDNGNETEWRRSPMRTPHFVAADLDAAAQIILAQASGRQAAAVAQVEARP